MGEKWHRVMQNLFGDQSEEEEEEVDSEHESNPHPNSVAVLLMAVDDLDESSTISGDLYRVDQRGVYNLTKAFQDYNNEMAQLRAGKNSKSKLTIVKFRLTFRMWLLLSMMEEWMPSSNSLSREMLFSLDMFSPDEGKSSFPKTNSWETI
ncbi:hypothetical protein DVH24_016111 [Malus domestica]|uniref:Uncharacterized protein n=1 Tax=Malus domestica TaxID=3750 RepID=A0A498JJB9_MALDO|nr:hypothetical protein DVH24_016111 [Malus domestica]